MFTEQPVSYTHLDVYKRQLLERFRGGDVFLLNGNIPLIDADTIRSAFDAHKRAGNAATILAAFVKNSNGYPHIARSADGAFAGILAEQDANETGREVFAGAGWFQCDQLLRATGQIAEECTGRESNLIDVVQCMLCLLYTSRCV